MVRFDNLEDKIAGYFPNGITDAFALPKPSEHEPYVLLLFNCPNSFYKKFCKKPTKLTENEILSMVSGLNLSKLDNLEIYYTDNNDKELLDINNGSKEALENQVKKIINITKEFERIINGMFEDFDHVAEELIQDLIDRMKESNGQKLAKQDIKLYNSYNRIYRNIKNFKKNEGDNFNYLDYESFILLICRVLKHFTGLELRLDFTDIPNTFSISFYGSDEQLSKLAEENEYELQLKNYALKYQLILDEVKKKDSATSKYSETSEILNIENARDCFINERDNTWKPLKYQDIKIKNVFCFSPYIKYRKSKEEKYMRYEKNDDYHECNAGCYGDEICGECSKFRNIDKLRIIYDTVDQMIKRTFLIKENILIYILIKRNYLDYGDKLEMKNIVFKSWNVFNKKTTMDFIYTVRNFYGEEISYYFLWLTSLIKFLFVPAFFGAVWNFMQYATSTKSDHHPVWNMILCTFYILWGQGFAEHWLQKEKMFNYFWGTENFKHLEPDSENFVPDGTKVLVFGKKFPYVKYRKTIFKIIVSYTVLFLTLFITIIIVYFIFRAKVYLIANYPSKATLIGILMALANAIQINVVSSIYYNIAKKLNDWQNHKKDYQNESSLAIKLILFEFINTYWSIFYIAFIKETTLFGKPVEQCYGFGGKNSCLEEIEIQLYTTLSVCFALNFVEIGVPLAKRTLRALGLKKKGHEIADSMIHPPHSLGQQMLCESYTTMIYEYSEMLVHFGYVLLFGVAAPLASAIILCLVYIEKFFDSYKLFFCVRVSNLDMSNGLEIYNFIMQILIYAGAFTNVAVIVFGDNLFMPESSNHTKALVYLGTVMLIFLLIKIMPWNAFPPWFEYLQDIKILYIKKYFSRPSTSLPHLYLLDKLRGLRKRRLLIPATAK